MAEFKSLAETLMQQNQTNGVKITQIIDRYLGKGKKTLFWKNGKIEKRYTDNKGPIV